MTANRRQYAKAGALFLGFIDQDLEPRERRSALDLGYGLGHYARLCKQAGFERYVGLDFAGRGAPNIGPGFEFRNQDIGYDFELGEQFDLVLAIDVIYHILDEDQFETALRNMRRHARNRIYVTGLFEHLRIAHCFHRSLERFAPLGRLVDVHAWRDNKLARFAVD